MAKRFTYIPNRVIDTNGISDGASIYVYQTGTTTPVAIYSDEALTAEISNPYVVASGAAVPSIYHDYAGNVRVKIVASGGATISDDDPYEQPLSDADLLSTATGKGAAMVGFLQSGTGAVARTVQSKLREFRSVTDLDGVDADSTDQTANMIAAINANVGVGDRVTMIVPNGVAWHPQELYANVNIAAKEHLVLLDLGGMNGARKAGENTKIMGVFGLDPDNTEDTYWTTTSAHHPVFLINNMGTANSTSAEEGLMSLLYARGYWTDRTDDDRNFKGAMIAQFRRSVIDTTIWEHVWRSLAPWGALADGVNYTRWAASTAYGVGDYVVAPGSGQIYKYTVAGTSGATEPTHTSGSAADGTATAQYEDVDDRVVFGFDQHGRVKTNGAGTTTDLAAFKQSSTDTTTTATLRVEGTGTSRGVALVASPTDGTATVLNVPGVRWLADSGSMEIHDAAGTVVASVGRVSGTFNIFHDLVVGGSAADLDTSPSVAGGGVIYINNSSATSITTFDGGQAGEEITVVALGNSNTTLVHSAGMQLVGAVNVNLTPYSVVKLMRLHDFITGSTVWVETGRSIK